MHRIRKSAKWILVMGLACACTDAVALDRDYYSASSELSTGNWVKIKVTETGMQQITASQLVQMGFSDLSKVSVFGYGGVALTDHRFSPSRPDDLPQQPVLYADGKIIFYGEADVKTGYAANGAVSVARNTAATGGYYFLTDSREIKTITATDFQPQPVDPATTHMSIVLHEEELTNPSRSGAHFFGRDFATEPVQTVSFHMPDRSNADFETVAFSMNGVLAGSSPVFTVTMPGDKSRSITGISTEGVANIYFSNVNLSDELLITDVTDDETYDVVVSSTASRTLSYGAIDRMTMSYARDNRYRGGQLRMLFTYPAAGMPVEISASGNLHVWDVSSVTDVKELGTSVDAQRNSVTVSLPPVAGNYSDVIAFDSGAKLHEVEFAGRVANQNLHGETSPDMIILSSHECRPQAERLAGLHRECQGMTVKVVEQDEVFNEFSSGTPSVMALRRMAKMHYDREPGRLKHLLLMGASHYDNRGITSLVNNHFDCFLLAFEVDNLRYMSHAATSYVSDAYFGMLADNYDHARINSAPMHVNVGRIPALRESDAKSAVDKIAAYLATPPKDFLFNRVMVLADGGDAHAHLIQAEQLCDTIKNTFFKPAVTVKCYNSLYPLLNDDAHSLREAVRRNLTGGIGYLAYMGHGSPDGFSGNNMWSRYESRNNSYKYAPFTMFSTCDTYAFDRNENGIAENMIYQNPGGSIAVVAASRTVYKDYNQYMNVAVAEAYFAAGEETTTGDIYRIARNHLTGLTHDPDILVNTLCYNFCGDPALPLYAPGHSVAIDNAAELVLYPLAANAITGNVTDSSGNVDTSFNGSVTVTLYEPATTSNTLKQGNYKNDKIKQVTRHETAMGLTSGTVTNGQFTLNVNCPLSANEGNAARMTISAVSADGTKRAAGEVADVPLGAFDADRALTDTEPPVIDEMYIDSAEFVDGDEVGGDIVLYASVLPDATGIVSSDFSLAGSVKLSLDGSRTYPYVAKSLSMRADGGADIEFPVTGLSDGRHELTLTVTDNAGNKASRTLAFTVINTTAGVEMKVTGGVAGESVELDIVHPFGNTPSGRLVIEDDMGHTVMTDNAVSFPFTWKFTGSDGKPVSDGRYRCYAVMRNGMRYVSTPKLDIVVVKN